MVSTAPIMKTGMMVMLAPTGVEILLMLLAVIPILLVLMDVEIFAQTARGDPTHACAARR